MFVKLKSVFQRAVRLFELTAANILMLFFLVSGISQAFETSVLIAPVEVKRAAQNGLSRFLNAIPGKDLHKFNFHSRDEFKNAQVSSLFRVFIVYPEDIIRGDAKKSLLDLVRPTTIWFFPVISQGEFRTILTVDFIANEWKAIEIGNSDLAKSFTAVITRWPTSKGYHYVFVRNYQTLSEFIILIRYQEVSVIPLATAISSWGLRGEKILELPEALLLLKNSLQKVNLQQERLTP
jgi:hypothetical protein